MEKKLRQLFDYQKFANNKELSAAIATCDNSSDTQEDKIKISGAYKRIFYTMTGCSAAAALLLVLNIFYENAPGEKGTETAVASLFTEGNIGYIAAGVIFVLGITVSVILFRHNGKGKD